MNKLKFLLLLLPLTSFAQLDKIKPGMTLAEVKKNFPGLKPDISAMSSWIYAVDTVQGLKGVTEYVIRQDTLLRYDFTSNIVSGPCKSYPDIKSEKYRQLLNEATKLYNQYATFYGKPVEYFTESGLIDDTNHNSENVFYAKWKAGNNELSITVSLPDKNKKPEMNGPPPTVEEMESGCKYTLEVLSIGTGNIFQKYCGNGITGQTFKQQHPTLAPQIENHPDAWMVADTLTSKAGNWEFTFEGGHLDSYSLDINDGQEYYHKTDTAYSLLRKRTLALKIQAEKKYGKPFKLVNKMFDKFSGGGGKFYQKNIYFAEEWKMEDKNESKE